MYPPASSPVPGFASRAKAHAQQAPVPAPAAQEVPAQYAYSDSTIYVHRVTKWYGQVIGLNDVTLSFPRGITGLLGPNGAGKSTLLKILTGQIKTGLGSVRIKGQNPWNNPGIWDFTGYCPEQEALFDRLTGFEFVAIMASLQGMSRSDAKNAAADAIETLGMTKFAGRRIGGYSKGMKQRIKLAQSIVHDPEILILDEPLGGTDPLVRHEIIKLLHKWERQGKTIIISSHVLEEVERITKEIVLIHRGRLLAEGLIERIRDLIDQHPHHIFIRTRDYSRLSARLITEPFVESVRKYEGHPGIMIETHKPNEFYSEIPKIILEENIDIESMGSQDDSLDAVFRYLVR